MWFSWLLVSLLFLLNGRKLQLCCYEITSLGQILTCMYICCMICKLTCSRKSSFFNQFCFFDFLDCKIKFEKLLKHWEWLVSKYGCLLEINMKRQLVWVYRVDISIELWTSLSLLTRSQTANVLNSWGSSPEGKIGVWYCCSRSSKPTVACGSFFITHNLQVASTCLMDKKITQRRILRDVKIVWNSDFHIYKESQVRLSPEIHCPPVGDCLPLQGPSCRTAAKASSVMQRPQWHGHSSAVFRVLHMAPYPDILLFLKRIKPSETQ